MGEADARDSCEGARPQRRRGFKGNGLKGDAPRKRNRASAARRITIRHGGQALHFPLRCNQRLPIAVAKRRVQTGSASRRNRSPPPKNIHFIPRSAATKPAGVLAGEVVGLACRSTVWQGLNSGTAPQSAEEPPGPFYHRPDLATFAGRWPESRNRNAHSPACKPQDEIFMGGIVFLKTIVADPLA